MNFQGSGFHRRGDFLRNHKEISTKTVDRLWISFWI
jgi:hypothetical protein